MSSNIRFKLKLSPAGWVSLAIPFVLLVIIPELVSQTRHQSVHMTALGYAFFGALAVLGVLRQVRVATVLEAEGVRMRRTFSDKFLPWNEITAVEVRERGKARIASLRTTSGQAVRLQVPMSGGGVDGSQFDAQVAEIGAALAAANPATVG